MQRIPLMPTVALLVLVGCASDAKQAATAPSQRAESGLGSPAPAASPPVTPPTGTDVEAISEIMSMKVVFAAPLLQAIATRDYATIERNAKELGELSTQAAFIVQDTVTYRALCETFRNEVTRLAADARRADQTAVEADYHRVAAACFNCHTHVRDERIKGTLPGRVALRPHDAGSRS